MAAKFIKLEVKDFEVIGISSVHSVSNKISLGIKLLYSNQTYSNLIKTNFKYSKTSGIGKISFLDSLGFVCAKSGDVELKVQYNGIEKLIKFQIIPYEIEEINPFLATAVNNSSLIVPVVVINWNGEWLVLSYQIKFVYEK